MDLAKIVDDSIVNNHKKEPRRYIGASGIGKSCSRAIWYDFNCVDSIQPTARELRIFETGHRLESMVINYIQDAGFRVEVANDENNQLLCHDPDVFVFQGHMDGILHISDEFKAILEIKTANTERFDKYANDEAGCKSWSPVYYAQVQSYMGMTGIHDCLFCVINKNNCEWRMEWLKFDDIFYHELKYKAFAISTVDCPPEKINKSPFYYACRFCKYKTICHAGDKE